MLMYFLDKFHRFTQQQQKKEKKITFIVLN